MRMNFEDVPDPGDRYEIGELIGQGVWGRVYSAKDTEASDKKVAVKHQRFDNETTEYVLEEYQILNDLSSHPNIVDFFAIYRKHSEIWFVMELCEGGPVVDLVNGLLAKNRRMVEEHIAYILKETVKALIYLHENNVIHRDVKGSNILLTKEGEVKLCDFGLSQKTRSKDSKLYARLGTPGWMAPEFIEANERNKDTNNYDNRVDVWALGITAIELGDGRAPFEDMHATRALFQILRNPPPTLHRMSNWTENYHDFISECLAKNPEYRPYMLEILEHPFLEQVPENNFHLTLEIKSILSDVDPCDPLKRHPETNIYGHFLKSNIDGSMEPMYDEDLAAIQNITENKVLNALEQRMEMSDCYSFMGDILLYLNPNKRNIYHDQFHRKYHSKSRSDNAPHIYTIADTAYQNALHHNTPQQIILSGESGSGKTTNYLHLIDHLFYLGYNPSINSERIKNAIKLIHSFINASTPSNDYSTRAVIKTNVFYGKTGKLSGANFKVQNLEKWRVSSVDMCQSNFHILYYIYDGLASRSMMEKYRLNYNRQYRYLRISDESKSSQPKNEIEKNITKYKKICSYFKELEFSEDQVDTIRSVIAAILNLGEVRFEANDDGSAVLENKQPISDFADLLQIDKKKLTWAMTNYCLVRGGNAMRKKNSCDEARDTRDVLANNLYIRLVDYVISVINHKLSFGKAIFGEAYTIKILDYFGFECFKKNHISQFMVNCLNEQLHYHFLQRVFFWEFFDLTSEEVEFTPISFYNNKDTLNELLGKPEGALSIIDDASKRGHGGRYVMENIHNEEKNKIMISEGYKFIVAHYTGKVSYDAKEMPDKNRDFLPPEVIETLRSSENAVISMFFTNKLDRTGNLIIPFEEQRKNKYGFIPAMSSNNQFSQIKKMRTQATIFRALCLDLLKELSVGSGSGSTHFVKCIRTDLKGRPQIFHKELVRQQIRAMAIVETARARQQGYPHRITFPEFLRRYKFLAFEFEENVEITRDNCRLLMVRLKIEGWALGRTKIFLKYHNEEYLARLYEKNVKLVIKVQSILRGFLAKCRISREAKKQEKECINEINKRRRSSVMDMTEDEAAQVIQKAYRTAKFKGPTYKPLKEEQIKFIKPFASKWKNNSMFSVLMRYRAIKLQDFFNFSQQVHLYNMNAFHSSEQITNMVELSNIDQKATVCSWLGAVSNSVLKLRFRLDDIPFYSTSHMRDDLTNHCSFADHEDSWDTPYLWRESDSRGKSKNKELRSSGSLDIDYSRDPDEPIRSLPIANDGSEDTIKENKETKNKAVRNHQFAGSRNEYASIDKNVSKMENLRNKENTRSYEPKIDKINLRPIETSGRNKRESENFIVNTKPANKDFEYIKATPVSVKPRYGSADPIAELRNISRRDSNASDDDPPYNFKGMLRKTNYRRDSLVNAMDTVRRFSLGKDQDNKFMGNGRDFHAEPIISRPVSLEIMPGVIIEGLEVDL